MIQNPSVAGSGETVTITVKESAFVYDNEGNIFGNGATFIAKKDIMIAAEANGRTLDFSGNCTVVRDGGRSEIYLFIPHGDTGIRYGW
jgi:hypothetical protein|nr:MAG TPA: hypothetical protein [Caudoviricetes sp.]